MKSYDLDYYDAAAARRRKDSIPGMVETEEQRAERERGEIKKTRREHAASCKNRLRELDAARHDYRLAKLGAGTAAVFVPVLGTGWFASVGWGLATSFSGGRGGPLAFFMVALLIGTILDAIGLVVSGCWLYERHGAVRKAENSYADAIEASSEYELDLLGHRPELA